MMKENSQKILLLTYGLHSVSMDNLKNGISLIAPTLTRSGIHSLIFNLRKQQFLYVDSFENSVSLTQQGRRLVESLFPAFSGQTGVLLLLVFLQPPKHDPQFRTLRRILLAKSGKQITRGNYLFTKSLNDELKITLERLYRGHILVVSIDTWVIGDKNSVLATILDETGLVRTYSGISREIEQLISVSFAKKVLTEQNKEKIHSVFSLFFNTIQTDTRLEIDLTRHELNPHQILKNLQRLLFYRP